MCSDDDDDHGDVRRGPRGTRVRRVSEGNQPHGKGGPKAGGGRGSKGDRPLNGERPKSLYADAKDSLADGKTPPVRRSLSPIKSPPAPASPALSKKISNDSSGGGGNLTSSPADVRKKDKLTRQQEKAQREAQQLPAATQGQG